MDNKLKVTIKDWYGLHSTDTFYFNQGITCLIGKNGAGKSTLLEEIKEALGEENVFFYDNEESEKNALSRFNFYGEIEKMCRNLGSSEGQNIRNNFEDSVSLIGYHVRKCINRQQKVIIMLDGLDSGISIDYIKSLKEDLFDLILKDCANNNMECYIILSANNYEFCANQDCINVSTGEHVNFLDYSDFRKFYLGEEE